MPDWNKVALTRAHNATHALKLLPKTAGQGYDFTPEQAIEMFAEIEAALAEAKQAYAARVPGLIDAGVALEQSDPETQMDRISAEGSSAQSTRSEEIDPITRNTRSDDPLRIPHWAAIKDFVALLDKKHLSAYILHISDRLYEDAL